jgi:hypothetical protein
MLAPGEIAAVATWLSSQRVAAAPAAAGALARPLPMACGSVPDDGAARGSAAP